jgi:predicted enzyme related to lactoylglutathione lyase
LNAFGQHPVFEETQMANPVLWFEVMGKDGTSLRRFYREVFGWQITAGAADAPFDYGLIARGERGVPGGIGSGSDGSVSFATFYVEVEDPTAFLARAEKLGGQTVMPATEIPAMNLTFAYFADPEGHVIGLSKGIRPDGQAGSSANPVLTFEVMGKNAKALRRFYTDLFGWNMSKAAAYDYWMIDTGGEGAIGEHRRRP